MSATHLKISDELQQYIRDVSLRESPVLTSLREETASLTGAGMQVSPEVGQFLALLVQILDARNALEVGVFTGYSSLAVARSLPADGKLIACDVSEEYTGIARRYWAEAGVDGRIDLRLAPALETLDGLIEEGEAGHYDFAFIDADKQNYDAYYERILTLLRPGGVAAIDNVLWHGRVIEPGNTDPDTEAIRMLNRKIATDARVSVSLMPIGDGLTLVTKRRR